MSVRVLFFGATAEVVGAREIQLELSNRETVGDLVETVLAMYGRLNTMRMLVAVNEEYAEPRRPLENGDSIAIFTPVSGG